MFVFGKLLTQYFYEGAIAGGHGFDDGGSEAAGETAGSGSTGAPHEGSGKACFGTACFLPTALVSAGLAGFAVLAALTLVCRTRGHYTALWGMAGFKLVQ
eukprot:SAG22_NODE_44_length_24912_cov_33.648894_2_plen_100_part_00